MEHVTCALFGEAAASQGRAEVTSFLTAALEAGVASTEAAGGHRACRKGQLRRTGKVRASFGDQDSFDS